MNKLVLSVAFGFLTGLLLLRPVLAQEAKYVPGFTLPGPDTALFVLSAEAPPPVMVVLFTSSHCAWAVKYQDRLAQLWDTFAPQQVTFVAINSNDTSASHRDALARMGRHTRYPFPYLKDADQAVARQFDPAKTPEVFVMVPAKDRFRIVYQGRIDDNPLAPKAHYLRDALHAVLAGTDPKLAYVEPTGCDIKWMDEEAPETPAPRR